SGGSPNRSGDSFAPAHSPTSELPVHVARLPPAPFTKTAVSGSQSLLILNPCRLVISDAPHCRHRWQIGLACIGGAIHEPDNPLASRAALPKNIRLAVPVKIARTSDAPHCLYRRQIGLACIGGAIHEPDNPLAYPALLPSNSLLTVTVCSLLTSDAPHCRHRWQIGLACIGGAIHEPDNPLASRAVLPKNIRLAVPVKIYPTSAATTCRCCSEVR